MHFHTTQAIGVGDLRLAVSYWLLNPDKYLHYNVSVSLGVKIPTGQDDITDTFLRPGGQTAERPVDLAIQPGDGGWGIILGINAFDEIYKNGFLFFQGTYLSNPRETNHVQVSIADEPFLTGPDPAQMEKAADLAYKPVPANLVLPDGMKMGAPSSVALEPSGRLLVFNHASAQAEAAAAPTKLDRGRRKSADYDEAGIRIDDDAQDLLVVVVEATDLLGIDRLENREHVEPRLDVAKHLDDVLVRLDLVWMDRIGKRLLEVTL